MTNPTNPSYSDANEIDTSTTASILHGDEPQAPHPLPAHTVTIMPGHILQAQSIQPGVAFISSNGNMITFAAPIHNVTVMAAEDDGSLNLQILGVNPQLFEAEGAE